jgi:hypothetical protein
MKLQSIILTTISTTTACFPCPNHQEDIALEDAEVTADDLLKSISVLENASEGEITLADIVCEDLCVEVWNRGWYFDSELENCSYELTIDSIPEERTDDIVGTITCSGILYECIGGRRPIGHQECVQEQNGLGGYFARCAHMEASSVVAFVQLARQLRSFDAPQELINRCVEAANDEILHAHLFRHLASEQGASSAPVSPSKKEPNIYNIALHNALEGCITETWAALLAHWQSMHSTDANLRLMYKKIARDETRHGQLSWDLHRWFLSKLDCEQQEEIKKAQQQALVELTSVAGSRTPNFSCLGLPSPNVAHQLAKDFGARLVS